MTLETTALYAVPLGAIYFGLWMGVAAKRGALKVSIGDGGDKELLLRIRRHGNFVDWVPMVLIMMVLAESLGAPAIWLHISGALLLLGRIVHPFGLKIDNAGHPLRYVGNSTNILALLNAMVCVVVNLLGL
ncbi:MAG: MAPEG family protein [Cypionkella sp.]|nr:MAPEG family protein [Cypionkella sp.]